MTGADRQSSCWPLNLPLPDMAMTSTQWLTPFSTASSLLRLGGSLCFLMLLAGSAALAQESSGSLTGTVTDSSGGVVVGARVTR